MSVETILSVHPHIAKTIKASGETSVIKGTQISVWMIAEFYKEGLSAEDIFVYYKGYIKMEQIFDALSFYYENKEAIDSQIAQNTHVDDLIAKGNCVDLRSKPWAFLF